MIGTHLLKKPAEITLRGPTYLPSSDQAYQDGKWKSYFKSLKLWVPSFMKAETLSLRFPRHSGPEAYYKSEHSDMHWSFGKTLHDRLRYDQGHLIGTYIKCVGWPSYEALQSTGLEPIAYFYGSSIISHNLILSYIPATLHHIRTKIIKAGTYKVWHFHALNIVHVKFGRWIR